MEARSGKQIVDVHREKHVSLDVARRIEGLGLREKEGATA